MDNARLEKIIENKNKVKLLAVIDIVNISILYQLFSVACSPSIYQKRINESTTKGKNAVHETVQNQSVWRVTIITTAERN